MRALQLAVGAAIAVASAGSPSAAAQQLRGGADDDAAVSLASASLNGAAW